MRQSLPLASHLFICIVALFLIYPNFSLAIMPPDQNVISPKYSGDDIKKVINEILKKAPPKDEFTTTEQYKAKLVNVNNEYSNSLFTFVAAYGKHPENVLQLPTIKYNAETKEMEIKFTSFSYCNKLGFRDPNYNATEGVFIRLDTRDKSSFIGTNAYGAKAKITSYTEDVYSLFIPKDKNRVVFHIEPDNARQLKDNFGMLAICSPAIMNLCIATSCFASEIEPTVQLPFHIKKYQHSLNVNPIEICFYNRSTGQVIYKHKY